MIFYSAIRVIDGDTIEVKLWPSGLCETCRILEIDTDEIDTKRGVEQRQMLLNFCNGYFMHPYIVCDVSDSRLGRKLRRDAYGRLLIKVYVWRWFRYVNYASFMKDKGMVKEGSKWNTK